MGDGNIRQDRVTGRWDGCIYQAKPLMVDKLRALLAGIPHSEGVRDRGGNTERGFRPSGNIGIARARSAPSMFHDRRACRREPVWWVATERGSWTARQGRIITLAGAGNAPTVLGPPRVTARLPAGAKGAGAARAAGTPEYSRLDARV